MATLVFLEHHENELLKASLGVLSKAAQLEEDVTGIVLGSGVRELAPQAGKFGAARVLVVDKPELEAALPQPRVDAQFEDFSLRATMVEQAHAESEGPSIEDADVIVAGGRGLGAPENFKLVEDLAKALGGAVGATRAVVDAGWYPYATQVGQTGKSVSPKLYVALGISGAIQHKVGMQGANVIVAVNKDPNAPIFEFCDLGVVGDVHEIAPKLTELVKAR